MTRTLACGHKNHFSISRVSTTLSHVAMHLHYALSIFAAGWFSQASAALNGTLSRSFPGWEPCPAYSLFGKDDYEAECVTYEAPLCYAGVCKVPVGVKPTIDVFVKRLRAKGAKADDAANVWFISGTESTTGTGRL